MLRSRINASRTPYVHGHMLQPHLLFISHGAKSLFVSPEGEESLAAVPLENDVSQSRPNCVRFPAALSWLRAQGAGIASVQIAAWTMNNRLAKRKPVIPPIASLLCRTPRRKLAVSARVIAQRMPSARFVGARFIGCAGGKYLGKLLTLRANCLRESAQRKCQSHQGKR